MPEQTDTERAEAALVAHKFTCYDNNKTGARRWQRAIADDDIDEVWEPRWNEYGESGFSAEVIGPLDRLPSVLAALDGEAVTLEDAASKFAAALVAEAGDGEYVRLRTQPMTVADVQAWLLALVAKSATPTTTQEEGNG